MSFVHMIGAGKIVCWRPTLTNFQVLSRIEMRGWFVRLLKNIDIAYYSLSLWHINYCNVLQMIKGLDWVDISLVKFWLKGILAELQFTSDSVEVTNRCVRLHSDIQRRYCNRSSVCQIMIKGHSKVAQRVLFDLLLCTFEQAFVVALET